MKKKSIIIFSVGLLIVVLAVVWYYYHRTITADEVSNQSRSSQLVPNEITFLGHITVADARADSILLVVNGNATRVSYDGNYVTTVARDQFLDEAGKTLAEIPVEFWNLNGSVRYRDRRAVESFTLHLPAEWRESGMVVYKSPSSVSYIPSRSFYVKRDFDLVSTQ